MIRIDIRGAWDDGPPGSANPFAGFRFPGVIHRLIGILLLLFAVLSAVAAGPVCADAKPPHVTMLAASPEGRLLAIASSRGWLTLWDLAAGQLMRVFKAHDDDIYLLRFSPAGDRLLTGSDDHTAKLWSMPGLENVRTFETGGVVTGGVVTADGVTVVLGLWDGTLAVWDVATGHRKAANKGHLFGRVTVDIAPSGKWIVTGGSDQTIRLWEAGTLRQVRYLKSGERGIKAHLGVVYGVRFLDDDRVLSSASRGSVAIDHLTLWDARTGRPVRSLNGSVTGAGVALAADNKRIVFTERNDDHVRAVIFDLTRWHTTWVLDPHDKVMAVALTPDGRLAVTGSFSGRIGFWDADNGRLLATAWSRFDRGWGVATPDGRRVAGDAAAGVLAGALAPYLAGTRR